MPLPRDPREKRRVADGLKLAAGGSGNRLLDEAVMQPDAQLVMQETKQNRPLVRGSHFDKLSEPGIFLFARSFPRGLGYLAKTRSDILNRKRRQN